MSGIAAASGNWRDADCRGECPTRRAHPWCAPCTDRRRAERRTCAALRPTRLKGSRAGGVTQHECDEGWNVARAEKVARARSARASNSSYTKVLHTYRGTAIPHQRHPQRRACKLSAVAQSNVPRGSSAIARGHICRSQYRSRSGNLARLLCRVGFRAAAVERRRRLRWGRLSVLPRRGHRALGSDTGSRCSVRRSW
jgi:hypothetical protein